MKYENVYFNNYDICLECVKELKKICHKVNYWFFKENENAPHVVVYMAIGKQEKNEALNIVTKFVTKEIMEG